MKVHSPSLPLVLALLCTFLGNGAAHAAPAADWLPVDPAHLAATAPAVEKDADAEAIFWDVRVQDIADASMLRTVLTHYVRIKIFTERGKEEHGQVEIPYLGRTRISEIAGRTIRPDGSIVELKNDAVFDRTVVKSGDIKVNVKSFAMPAVEPGAVVEYRWKETRSNALANYLHLQFSRDIPVQRVTYHIKPLNHPDFPYGMRSLTFHGQASPFVKESDGFYATSMTNVPAFHEEPRMPAEEQVRPWMLIYYTEDRKVEPAKYWAAESKKIYDRTKNLMKVNDEVRKAAAEIAGDAATPEKKLERFYEFCRTEIKNVDDDASGLTDAELEKVKENKQPADTLKRKMGTDGDVNLLFAALASAAGFDARIALTGDHRSMRFDPKWTDDHFLNLLAIAVKVGDQWRFYDASETYLPAGMLYWAGSGQNALVADPKELIFVETPDASRDLSVEKRTAKLELSEDGTLEGTVRVEYTGHLARARKEYNDDDAPSEREKTLRTIVTERISTAEVSDVKVENVTDPGAPFVYEYRVKIPGYAQRTGKRLFVQPAFFQYNKGPLFPAAERRHLIRFEHAWTEEDEVDIELPEGFALDHADAPEGFSMGAAGAYEVKIFATEDGRAIRYSRRFTFGGPGLLLFAPKEYEKIKLIFDTVHERDKHALTLKASS